MSKIILGRRRGCCRGGSKFRNLDRRSLFTARRSFAVPRDRGARCRAEMKKAAEVDFTWAAFAGTYEKKVLAAIASQVRGKRLENLRHRCLYGPRASGGIDAEGIANVIAAKQSFAAAPRRARRGAFHEARWLTNDQHDDVTLSAAMFAVKDIFSKSRKRACGLVSRQLVSAGC